MKVKELIEKLKKFDENMEIVAYESDMERSGIQPVNIYPRIIKVKEVTKSTWDRFDGTDYTYTTYVQSETGDTEVMQLY